MTRGICYNLSERPFAHIYVHGDFKRIEMIIALRTVFTRNDVLESLCSRKVAFYADASAGIATAPCRSPHCCHESRSCRVFAQPGQRTQAPSWHGWHGHSTD